MDYEEITMQDFVSVKIPGRENAIKSNKICLLDADYIRYLVVYKIYKEIEKKDEHQRAAYFQDEPSKRITAAMLDAIFENIKDPIIFCFSGTSSNTFRSHLAFDKMYKGTRRKVDNYDYPQKMNDMKESIKYIQDNYMTLLFPDLEADDIVSALQCEDTFIMSKDKDLKQVPGWHYDWQMNKLVEITKPQALFNLAYQLLAGDTTDNISGIPGCGPVNANKILAEVKNPTQYISRVLREYHVRFGVFHGTDMFAETWMLVKMREKRGDFFINKYKSMFDLKQSVLLDIKKHK